MLKCVIFDMNGVVVDDERIHQESWRQLCKKYDFSLTEEEFKQEVFGRTEKDIFQHLLGRGLTPDELEARSAERVKIAMDIFRPRMALTEGLREFLEYLRSNNIPMAIATSSRRPYTNFILDGFDIRSYFQTIVTAEDISKGKPDPEMYLITAKEMKVDPADCVVFEDSVSGIKSAKAAGMKVVAITTTHQADELSSADKIISSFVGLTASDLAVLF